MRDGLTSSLAMSPWLNSCMNRSDSSDVGRIMNRQRRNSCYIAVKRQESRSLTDSHTCGNTGKGERSQSSREGVEDTLEEEIATTDEIKGKKQRGEN